jgi:type VI secretion system secreted protein VgrG
MFPASEEPAPESPRQGASAGLSRTRTTLCICLELIMPDPTQENRQLIVKTPLGKDVLLLTSFTGHEEMSRLFTYRLEMVSKRDFIAAKDIVGKNITFQVRLADDSMRSFNGFVTRFAAGSRETGMRRYEAEVVPWLWFLTRTADCRIFQKKTIPQIIEKIFDDLGFSDYETSEIKGSHEEWEYCVQYRETDFNFVSRLMEQEGIFYYFRHEDGKHTLVLADQKGAYKDCPEKDVEYEYTFGALTTADRLTSWEHEFAYTVGKWAQTDYNFIDHPHRAERTPAKLMMTNEQSTVQLDKIEKYEVYDYPGEYDNNGEGKNYTKLRMEEDEVPHDTIRAASTCRTFMVGGKFKVKKHDCKAEEGKTFVITAIQHSSVEPSEYSGGAGVGPHYTNSFSGMPDSVTFRPTRATPKPVIQGSQTAVVTGPDGEEIWPDKYGRVKVQFNWDREGKRDENTSCWIRTMQASAGKGWGSMYIPRIGQEVVVSYLEGDPDRPLITGLVYNADQTLPYPLPDEKTKTYIKTNTSKGGEGYNEVRFEDKKDKEQIFIHAQKDMDTRVLNNSTERIIANRHQIIGWEKDGKKGGDQREMVYRDKHLKVHRNQVEHIGGDMKLLIGGIDGDGNQDIVIKNDKKELIENNSHLHVKNDRMEKIDMNQSLSVGMNQQEKVGMNHALEAGMEIHLKAGMKVVIEAGMQMTIQGPGGFIDLGPAGITIQGVLVNINSGGAAGAGSGSSPTDPKDAEEAKPTEPDVADNSKTGKKSTPY